MTFFDNTSLIPLHTLVKNFSDGVIVRFLKGHCKNVSGKVFSRIRNVTERNMGGIETWYRNLLLRPAVFAPVEQKQQLKSGSSKPLFPSHASPGSPSPAHLDSGWDTDPNSLLTLPINRPTWELPCCQLAGTHLFGCRWVEQGQATARQRKGALQGTCVTVPEVSLKKNVLVNGLKMRSLEQWHFG